MTGLKRLGPPPALIALAGGMVLAAILGLHNLAGRDLWFDEAFSVWVARLDGSRLLHEVLRGDPSQGLYYLLLHLWLPVGESEAAVRSLSVIFGVATVPFLYLTAKELFGHKIAATAALLLPLNSFFIEQSQEARGYSLVIFLVTVSTYLYVRAATTANIGLWIAYSVVGALAVFTHLYALFVLGAHAMVSFLFHGDRKRRSSMVLIGGAVLVVGVIVALPIIKVVVGGGRYSWIWFSSGDELVSQIGLLVGQKGVLLLFYLFVACIGVAVLVQNLANRGGDKTWRFSIPASWFFIPIVASMIGSFITPMFVPRYLSVCVPGLVLLIAIGAWEIKPRFLTGLTMGTIIVTSAISLNSWYSDPPYFKSRPWKTASSYLLTNAEDGDVVLFDGSASAVPFSYYRSILSEGPDDLWMPYLPPTVAYGTSSATRMTEGLEDFRALDPRPPRVWVILSTGGFRADAQDVVVDYVPLDKYEIGDIVVGLYTLDAAEMGT